MTTLSVKADLEAEELARYYLLRNRVEAALLLRDAVSRAVLMADNHALKTNAFPSTYPGMSALGYRWFKVHRYWFAIDDDNGNHVIAHIYYDQADIPSRVDRP